MEFKETGRLRVFQDNVSVMAGLPHALSPSLRSGEGERLTNTFRTALPGTASNTEPWKTLVV
jgi:hypothetical protein